MSEPHIIAMSVSFPFFNALIPIIAPTSQALLLSETRLEEGLDRKGRTDSQG